MNVGATLLFAMLIALYLRKNTRINSFLQNFIFTPYIISLISVAFIWMWLMDSDYGLLNHMLRVLGLPAVRWLEDPDRAMISLVMVAVWKGVGYNVIILVSAMQAVPGYLYEAARLDRTRPLKMFFRVTFPMISPTLFFLALMDIIGSFKVFETVNVMTKGGPVNSTNTLVFDIYRYGFEFYKMGYASAEGVVLLVFIGACTVVYFGVLSKRVHYK
jgi:sn-glycerol 3-phosphate transport system permease protein